MWRNPHHRGFTLVELMVTIAIAVILIAVAVPSFRGYFAKKKVEGTIAELATDIQFARSEAVARNANVRMTFGTNCYVIHLAAVVPAACTNPAVTGIRTVRIDDTSAVSLAATGALTYFEFDSVRGETTLGGLASTATQGTVDVQTTVSVSSPVRLRAVVTRFGRVQVCTTNGIAGYATCT